MSSTEALGANELLSTAAVESRLSKRHARERRFRWFCGSALWVAIGFLDVLKVALHRNAFLPNTGVLASDLAADAMHLLAPDRPATTSVSLRYLYDLAEGTRQGESVVGGMTLERGQILDAPPSVASRRQLQIAQARLKQSERIFHLIQSNSLPSQFPEKLEQTLDQTAKEDQFRLAWSVLQATSSPESSLAGR